MVSDFIRLGRRSPGSFNGMIVSSGTYGIDLAASFPYTIISFLFQTTGGICQVSLTQNGTSLTGVVGVTTVLQTFPLNAAVAIGDALALVITNLAGGQELTYSVHYQ
jgi:hypothetical protein